MFCGIPLVVQDEVSLSEHIFIRFFKHMNQIKMCSLNDPSSWVTKGIPQIFKQQIYSYLRKKTFEFWKK
jgi:hypothetical protein